MNIYSKLLNLNNLIIQKIKFYLVDYLVKIWNQKKMSKSEKDLCEIL